MSSKIQNSAEIKKTEFCVIDFETTGTSARFNRVIEIGLVKVKNLKITENYQTLINPGVVIPYHITNLTGIKSSDVINSPKFEHIAADVLDFIGDSVLVAHNLNFDIGFLKNELGLLEIEMIENPTLCTLKLARKLYPEFPSKSLGNLTRQLRIRHKNIHRALGDSTVTAKLLIKMIKQLKEDFDITEINDLLAFQGIAGGKKSYRIIKKKLAADFEELPNLPGVYFFKNSKDEIIYIGKAKDLKNRVKSYFSNNALRKTKKIVKAANRLDHKVTNSELTALLTEAELIKKHRPPFNTMLKKYGQNYFVKINLDHNFPDLIISTEFDFDGCDYFGPYNSRDTAKFLVNIANRSFELRECNDKEFSKGKSCYLFDLNRCTAPCVNNDSEKYKTELERTYEFLSGQNQEAVNRLINKMKRLSVEQKYEDAAEIRDSINLLLNQLDKTSVLKEPINLCEVLLEIDGPNEKDHLLIIEGKVFQKDNFLTDSDLFTEALDDYYSGAVHLFSNIAKKDLEKIKITLSWLIKNRNRVSVYYLKDYNSKVELFESASLKKYGKSRSAEFSKSQ